MGLMPRMVALEVVGGMVQANLPRRPVLAAFSTR
ncbi:MAG: hypothetical protein RLZZ84_32 [Pseudomonadota bacterium]|jgi:hypothetical protein